MVYFFFVVVNLSIMTSTKIDR